MTEARAETSEQRVEGRGQRSELVTRRTQREPAVEVALAPFGCLCRHPGDRPQRAVHESAREEHEDDEDDGIEHE